MEPQPYSTYQVFKETVEKRPQGSYATEISNNLDISTPTVSTILNRLYRKGVLYKREGKRPQYYAPDIGGIAELFQDLWRERIEERGQHVEQMAELWGKWMDDEDDVEEEFLDFLAAYVVDYLEGHDEGTLEEMLVDDFYLGLTRILVTRDNEDVPDWLHGLYAQLSATGFMEDPATSIDAGLRALDQDIDKEESRMTHTQEGGG